MKLSDKLKKIRLENNLTLEELALRLNKHDGINVSKGTISRWENGKREPKNTFVSAYAKEFNIDLNELYDIQIATSNTAIKNTSINSTIPSHDYPILPFSIAAGSPTMGFFDLANEIITISDDIMGRYAGNKDIFLARASGESMNKVIPHGSIMAIKKSFSSFEYNNNDIVVFCVDGQEYSVKRFIKDDENKRLIFRPESTDPFFEDLIIEYENIENRELKLLGKVVMYSVLID